MKPWKSQLILIGLLILICIAEGQKKGRRKKIKKGSNSVLGTQPVVGSFGVPADGSKGLFPNVFNLASGAIITANATCGDPVTEVYCKLVEHVFLRSPQCGICDSSAVDPAFQHPIRNAIDGTPSWWQSPSLQQGKKFEWVTITIDLRQVFQVAYIVVKSAISPRPGNWILERSIDGDTFEPWQYYAVNDGECLTRYGVEAKSGRPTYVSDTEVICTSEYSAIHPLEDGEIHTSLMNGRPGAHLPTDELRNFTRARFVRLRLQKIRTFNEELMSSDSPDENGDSLFRRFFYSIRDISIGGMCDCNGHASSCPENPATKLLTCDCQHNTCGASCGECCPLFHQQPWRPGISNQAAICHPCNCHGHASSCVYDENVAKQKRSLDIHGKYNGGGVCQNCTDFTTGINCEKCLPGYFRPSGVQPTDPTPCFECNCDPIGTVGECIPDDFQGMVPGTCQCKEGFGGIYCDTCAKGYRNYPLCEPCPCNLAGSEGNCDGDGCKCKKNVEGERCDRCKPGYFNLQADNPYGCTKCFCSRQSKECASAGLGLTKVHGLEGWMVSDLKGKRILEPFIEEDGHYTIADDDMNNIEHYFWAAPSRYLGKRIMSYGENLVARVSWIKGRGDTGGKPSMAYDFIIENNTTRLAFGVHYYPDDDNVTLVAPLKEDMWTDLSTDTLADRDKLMTVLMNVTRLLIRAKYHTSQIEGSLHSVDLATCTNELAKPGEPIALGVERCKCPKGRAGLSCELCDYGYVMRAGVCEPCNCNGHARSCDPDTGDCTECEHNTMGPNCSKCKPGYHGNPTTGGCKRCTCPLDIDSNNFSPTCVSVDVAGEEFVCNKCRRGHEGNYCERCAHGFYGDPRKPGDYCKPCSCPDSSKCHPLTGHCLECPGNTAGWSCEKCKEGFFGDPASGGCRPCNCNDYGATSSSCDQRTGQCHCRERFTGRGCDKCKNGFGNLAQGCPPCGCNGIGSITTEVCDSVTGQCECRDGVEGVKCDRCSEFFYGFESGGCKSCNCHEAGALKRQCDIVTGQCECREHVIGRRCDKCQEGFWNLSVRHGGCIECTCDPIGSVSSICDQSSGQCPCKRGIGGLRCDQCLHGYFGFSENGCSVCEPCTKPGHICDPDTGRCVCPPYTEGEFCERCVAGSFGHHPLGGCKPCSCKGDGTRAGAATCDPITGRCSCRNGVVGEDCDRCAFGYYGFPKCQRCDCSAAGTDPNACREDGVCQCDADGQCPCKVNAVGRKCNQCLDGTFGLSEENPDGCTSCFCFGRSQSCVQAEFTWSQLRLAGPASRRQLKIEFRSSSPGFKSVNQFPVNTHEVCFIHLAEPGERRLSVETGETILNVTNNLRLIPGDSGDVTIGVSNGFNTPLYWSLPAPFLGDKILSYNGYLRFVAESDRGSLKFPASILTTYPLVQIQGNRRLVLEYFPPLRTQSGQYLVRFHESLWRLKNQPQHPVTREILMACLQNLQSILIRATESADSQRAILRDVSMDVAVPSTELKTTPLARGVELCFCPSEYNATSCQNPSIGFYRWYKPSYETSTIIIDLVGEARRCECNGRAETCDRETGVCQDCRDNTTGPHCEECALGYYGDPSVGACRPCACPSRERNHALHCPTNRRSPFGHECECAPGYAGARCEQCAAGYFGDALEGSCEPCNCDVYGSLDQVCDPRTGGCRCRPGITGRHCTQCAPRHVIMESECQSCDDDCTGLLLDDFESLTNEVKSLNLSRVVPLPWGRVNNYETQSYKITQELLDMRLTRDRAIVLLDGPDFTTQVDMIGLRVSGMTRDTINMPTEGLSVAASATELLQVVTNLRGNVENIVAYFKNYAIGETSSVNIDKTLDEAESHLAFIKGLNFDCESTIRRELQKCTDLIDNVLKMLNKVHVVDEVSGRHDVLISRLFDLVRHSESALGAAKDAQSITSASLSLLHFINSTNLVISNSKCHSDTLVASNQTDVADDILDEVQQTFTEMNDISNELSEKSSQLRSKIREQEIESREVRGSVRGAQAHADDLTGKAKGLFDQFNRTRGVADEPLRAAGAYQRIVDGIHEARNASKAANIAADTIFTEVYPDVDSPSVVQKSVVSKRRSEDLIKEAKNLQSSVKLHKMQFRGDHEILAEIQDTLNHGSRTDMRINGEVDKLQSERNSAISVFDKAMEVESAVQSTKRKLDDTREKIAQLRQRLNSIGSPHTQGQPDGVQHHIAESKKNYELLETQIIVSQRRVSEIKLEQEKFLLDLDALKRKIKKAKQEANGVRVSVTNAAKDKKCIRSYLPELRPGTTSSISLTYAVTGKDKNAMLTYLPSSSQSDFMLVEMVNRRIRFIWSAGGSEGSVTHPMELQSSTDDLLDDSRWYRIEAERIGSVGRLSVRPVKPIDDEIILGPITGSSSPAFTRTDLTTGDRLWIGGVPDEYNISTARGIPGCLYQLSVNGQQIGLWNFVTNKNCGPCIEGAEEVRDESAFHFGGQGYAEVPQVPHYDPRQYSVTLSIRTYDSDALLFLASGGNTKQYLMVDMKDGTVRLIVVYDSKHTLTLQTKQVYNTGRWVKIEATRVRYKGIEKALLIVSEEELTISPWTKREAPVDLELEEARLFLGGTPPDFRPSGELSRHITDRHLRGCLKDVQVVATGINPLQGSNFDVLGFCKDESERTASFSGRGYLQLPPYSVKKDFSLSVNFRTTSTDALILISAADIQDDSKAPYYSLALVDGRIRFGMKSGADEIKILGDRRLSDGILHTATIIKQDRKIELYIDEGIVGASRFEKSDGTILPVKNKHQFLIGGTPAASATLYEVATGSSASFDGCISDLIINNEIVGFDSLLKMESVSIGRCKPEMPLASAEAYQVAQDAPQNSCAPSGGIQYEDGAISLGDSSSSFAAIPLKQKLKKSSGFNLTLEFRSYQPDGLLFYVPINKNKKRPHFFATGLKSGRISGIVSAKETDDILVKSNSHLSDGEWHTVTFERDGRRLLVYIDGRLVGKTKLSTKVNLSGLAYIGGVPHDLKSNEPLLSVGFQGCVRKLQLDQTDFPLLSSKNVLNNVNKCVSSVEEGAYFSADSYAILDRNFKAAFGVEVELQFRTFEKSGILMSIPAQSGGGSSLLLKFNRETVELQYGSLILQTVSSTSLCNGKWHNVRWSVTNNGISLSTDGKQETYSGYMEEIAEGPLIIGGNKGVHPQQLARNGFSGCIGDVIIDKTVRAWRDMHLRNDVQVDSCPR